MKTRQTQTPYITLPSFLRRVDKTAHLTNSFRDQGGELKRIGRTRHWQVYASREQIDATIKAIEASTEPSWQWLVTHLSKQHKDLAFDMLLSIAEKKPAITVSELMQRTDCTIAQARKVIDTLEFSD